jgi:hypothetical protein
METYDGFIIGVYNYCDRWCERCRLQTRCRVFVDQQLDRSGIGLTQPPELARPRSLGAVAADDEPDGGRQGDAEPSPEPEGAWPVLSAEAASLDARTRALCHTLLDWPVPAEVPGPPPVADALRTVAHFGFFLGPKVHRALIGLHDAGGDRTDANGSAKAALLALDELEEAWLRLAEAGLVPVVEAEPVLRELAGVKEALDRRFPQARGFVRPGLDEPEAVAMLEWQERG